ncbi:leucine-rich repeat domain-containing protein [Porphyromonas cangingivalis]|uniref:leucine-rich repeat domain-containing protein n=1 Tax=Porphyromonas cangingivalis TaxID=36874 RepID=UPI00051D0746|nr:leucine-rich repeat domain-containing protein [Porphyromonas cangingivalis]KGL48220.1 hypothetical protein HQ34_06910 [Porphyromonas cangingivalis]
MDRVDKPRCVLDFEKHNKIKIKDFTGYGNHLDPLKRAFSMALLGAEDHFKLDDKGNVISLSLTSYFGVERIRLDMFPTLRSLSIISYTNLSKIEGLDQLKKLKMLDLSDTKLKEIKGLDQLKSLTTLNLSNTKISEIKGLDQLGSLTTLNLSNTKISEIKGLDQLKYLTLLDLSGTSLSEIKSLDQLENLITLKLSNTNILEIRGLNQLKNLIALDLSYTKLKEIKGLDRLKKLETLNLSDTEITELKGLCKLRRLKTLFLSNANIERLESLHRATIEQLENFRIDGNPFLIFEDIILPGNRNHKDDILNLIEEQKEEKVSFEYPYKVMLLGNHSAGKSSFLKCYDRAYKYKGSTHILQIFKSLKKGHPKVIFYDFGGQDYYHGIYQAFFTNEAINLLFWYDKTDHNKRAKDRDGINILNFNRLYWLSQIGYASQRKAQSYQKYENDTFVIQTHADMNRQKTLGAISMGKEPTSLVNEEFFVALDHDNPTSLTSEEKAGYLHAVRYLKSRLKSAVTLKNGEKLYPKSQIDLYNEIQELQKTTGHECVKVSELLKDYTRDLLKAKLYQLYRKGEVLYYRWSEELEDVVWLNPAETVRYIHTILSKGGMIKEKGRISEEKMKKAFEKDPKLLNLLSLEKVVFHDEKKKTYIIPGYLPLAEEDEAYSWLTLGFMSPNFILKFESFIPFGLINQLICYYGSGENELKRYWRDQLIFTLRNEYMVWIALDFEHLMIKVHINPLPNGSKEKITQLEQEIFRDLFCFYWDRMPLQERIEKVLSSPPFDFLGPERQAIERENVTKRIRDDIFSERRENPITDLYLSVYDPNLKVEDQLYVHLETLDDPEKTKSKIMGYPLTADGQIDKDRGQTLSTKRYKHLSVNSELKSVRQIFISYSKADREDLMELNKFLEDLKREEKIEVYYDETTTPGDMIHEVIRQKIIEADYVIALVSQDYISTEYIRDVELPLIKEKNKCLIPIIIKPCTWTMNEISNHYATLKGTEISFPDWNKDSHPGNYEACRAQNWTRAVTEISQKLFNNKDN